MAEEVFLELNEIFHVKARLGIMTLLLSFEELDFNGLKSKLGLTDGNLGAHLRVLEDAGYIELVKGFVGRRPHTTCRITEHGREAFREYLKQLETVIQMARTEKE